MLTTIKTAILLACLRIQAYSLAITIAGRAECFWCVRDPLTLANMDRAQDITRREHRRIEREIARINALRSEKRRAIVRQVLA